MTMVRALGLALVMVLSGCLAGPGAGPVEVGEGTSEAGPPAPDRAPKPRPLREGEVAPVVPAAATEAAPEPEPEPAPEPAPEPEIVPPPAPSAEQKACERRGGRYGAWGDSGYFVCYTVPRDAGQQCRTSGDCSSVCLARSRTCAPIQPMFGCTEILNEFGGRMTECIK